MLENLTLQQATAVHYHPTNFNCF